MPHIGEMWVSAGAVTTVALGGSPATYNAPSSGVLIVSGGTVSLVEIGRGATWIAAGLVGGVIPLSAGDKARVTYVVAPTVTFLGR